MQLHTKSDFLYIVVKPLSRGTKWCDWRSWVTCATRLQIKELHCCCFSASKKARKINPQHCWQLLQFSSSRPEICREHADDVGPECDESIDYANLFGGVTFNVLKFSPAYPVLLVLLLVVRRAALSDFLFDRVWLAVLACCLACFWLAVWFAVWLSAGF